MTEFSLAYVNALLRRARRAGRLPEDAPDGWQLTRTNFNRLVSVFDRLRMKSGYVLRAYTFRQGGNGNGFIYAMPADAPFPEPGKCLSDPSQFLSPPIPAGALAEVMAAIEGDGSPESYLQASLLARELREFGAQWHGCDWSTHEILDRDPRTDRVRTRLVGVLDATKWEWLQDAGDNWQPRVDLTAGPDVLFYTYSGLGGETVTKHTDRYRPNTYEFEQHPTIIGLGGSGFVF